MLDDEDSSNPAHGEDVRLDGLNAALRAMMAYRPLQAQSHAYERQSDHPAGRLLPDRGSSGNR